MRVILPWVLVSFGIFKNVFIGNLKHFRGLNAYVFL